MTKRSQFQAHLRDYLHKQAASVTVTRSCGHAERHDLHGKQWQRDREEAWLESTPCLECYHAQQLTTAQEQAQRSNLPPLQGSEKQIAWAETLRATGLAAASATMLKAEERFTAEMADLEPDEEAYRQQVQQEFAALQAADEALRQEATAHWWIDHRAYVKEGRALLRWKMKEAAMTRQAHFQARLRAKIAKCELRNANCLEAVVPVNPLSAIPGHSPFAIRHSQSSPTPTYPQPMTTPKPGYRWVWDPAKGQWDQVAEAPGKVAAMLRHYLKLS